MATQSRWTGAFGAVVGVTIATGLIYWSLRPVRRSSPRLSSPLPPMLRPPAAPARGVVAPPSSPAPSRAAAAATPGTFPSPSMTDWGVRLAKALRSGIQLPYALKWLELESGGMPCAVGYPAAKGPDGYPREMGIAMFYNPSDLQRLGLTSQQLRAYCVAGDDHTQVWGGKTIKGFSKQLARPMTDAELQQQATATIGLIAEAMHQADGDLHAAGVSWPLSSRDYWTLVKLQHGLPALSREGLPAVTKHLGRPPTSWREFRDTLASVKLSDNVESGYRDKFGRILDNAEKCASAFVERAVI